MDNDVISIKQLNYYIKSVFEGDRNLKDLFIIGEINNFKNHFASGHLYFSLKDDSSCVRCIMFSDYASNLRFVPCDGIEVLARCDVSLFEKTGTYQLYIKDMQKLGNGKLNLELTLLAQKLEKEGIFRSENKKLLPKYPLQIGVISSKTGAVIEDIKTVLAKRYPIAQIIFYPSSVQGETSAQEIIRALNYFNNNKAADVIIIARGGGAEEDLSAFNDENLVRKIYDANIPVVSAVGHETNFTLCDYVADLRAATPSAAAELVSPDLSEISQKINFITLSMNRSISEKIKLKRKCIDSIMSNSSFISPKDKLQKKRFTLNTLKDKLDNTIKFKVNKFRSSYDVICARLELMNPFVILERGYSIALDKYNRAIKTIQSVKTNDTINIKTTDGIIKCKVISTQEE